MRRWTKEPSVDPLRSILRLILWKSIANRNAFGWNTGLERERKENPTPGGRIGVDEVSAGRKRNASGQDWNLASSFVDRSDLERIGHEVGRHPWSCRQLLAFETTLVGGRTKAVGCSSHAIERRTVPMLPTTDTVAPLETLAKVLQSEEETLPLRFRALFALRGAKGAEANAAREAIVATLGAKSALLRHELAFCLGQMQDEESINVLERILADKGENSMVRHEAGEALGAIACPSSIPALEAGAQDDLPEVRETCELALFRIRATEEAIQSQGYTPYKSVDPAPPLPSSTPINELRDILLDGKAPMYQRYGAMFALRNLGTDDSARALAEALKEGKSALLKHELAYVLGQLQSPITVPALEATLRDTSEHPMVRHEAAEALGSIATPEARDLLMEFLQDPEPAVSESCEVALDILKFETTGGFQYCALDA